MVQRVVVQKTDDINGTDAAETISFALDGTTYEIDLNTANAEALREAIRPYAAAARRVGRVGRNANVSVRASAPGYDPKAVRAWAASNKVEMPARGRIPLTVVAQYRAAGN